MALVDTGSIVAIQLEDLEAANLTTSGHVYPQTNVHRGRVYRRIDSPCNSSQCKVALTLIIGLVIAIALVIIFFGLQLALSPH